MNGGRDYRTMTFTVFENRDVSIKPLRGKILCSIDQNHGYIWVTRNNHQQWFYEF